MVRTNSSGLLLRPRNHNAAAAGGTPATSIGIGGTRFLAFKPCMTWLYVEYLWKQSTAGAGRRWSFAGRRENFGGVRRINQAKDASLPPVEDKRQKG